jgi:hypothetical protein
VSFPCLWVKKLSIWLLCREEETVVFCGRHTHTLLKPNFTFISWFFFFFLVVCAHCRVVIPCLYQKISPLCWPCLPSQGYCV